MLIFESLKNWDFKTKYINPLKSTNVQNIGLTKNISGYGMVTHRTPVRGTSAMYGDKGAHSDEDCDDDDTGTTTAMVRTAMTQRLRGSRRRPGHQGLVRAEAGTGPLLQGGKIGEEDEKGTVLHRAGKKKKNW